MQIVTRKFANKQLKLWNCSGIIRVNTQPPDQFFFIYYCFGPKRWYTNILNFLVFQRFGGLTFGYTCLKDHALCKIDTENCAY